MPDPTPESDADLLARAGLAPRPEAEGLFGDDGWLRRVAREPVVLFGGVRALLLEIAHPLVAAGVADHSDFRRDPMRRLTRTLDAMSALTFEPRARALAAAHGVAQAHERVRGRLRAAAGPFAAGTSYSGRDPVLVRWVWATLVDTALALYRDFVASLDAPALAEYHRDQRALGVLLGADPASTPGDPEAFRRWFDGVVASDALTVSDEAREIARAVLATPGAADGPVALITGALLPPRLRDAFGIAWDADGDARYRALVRSVRALRPAAPDEVDAAASDR